ncbi:MAG: DUF1761 domain-containing protein [Patescibacteria group bacterium]
MLDFTINYFWVVILSVLAMGVGALWYSPVMFGNLVMKLSGMDAMPPEKIAQMKKKATKGYVVGFVGTLIMFAAFDMFLTSIQASSLLEGAIAGLVLVFGFIGVATLNHVLWGNDSPKLWLLNLAHYVVILTVVGAVFAVV